MSETSPAPQQPRIMLALIGLTVALLVVMIGIASYRISQMPEPTGEQTRASKFHDTTADAPKMLTVKKAGRAYLKAVGPANAAMTKLNDNEIGVTPMSTWRAEGKAARDKQRAFLDVLTHTAWPLQVQPHADGLAVCVGGYVRYLDAISDSKTYDELPIPSDFCSATNSGEAGVIRSMLGLKADV